MRAVVQRVEQADVAVGGGVIASIGVGMLVLVGAVDTDTSDDVVVLARKLVTMRVFSDSEGRMNLSVSDIGGSVLVVSQFTLLADITKGRRPSFTGAAKPAHARALIDQLVAVIADHDVQVASGEFGAAMDVSLVNSGPVTFIVDVAGGKVVS
jgi:D-tyrosyl-tRNA(Tyr) deacylase